MSKTKRKFSIIDKLFFNYIPSYIAATKGGVLSSSDVDESSISTSDIIARFEAAWENECKTHAPGDRSLYRAIFYCNQRDFLYGIGVRISDVLSNVAIVICLQKVLEHLAMLEISYTPTYIWAAGFTLSTIVQLVAGVALTHAIFRLIQRSLIGIKAIILKKSEDLGRFANVYSTHGEQMNLLAADAENAAYNIFAAFNAARAFVMVLVLGIAYPIYLLHLVAFAGIGIYTLLILAIMVFVIYLVPLDRKRAQARGVRLSRTSEILENMKLMKIHTWDAKFGKECIERRGEELVYFFGIGNQMIAQSSIVLLAYISSLVVDLYLYFKVHSQFDPSVVFALTVCLGATSKSLAMVPGSLSRFAVAMNALDRIQQVLEEELPCKDWHEHTYPSKGELQGSSGHVVVQEAVFSYVALNEDTVDQIVEMNVPAITQIPFVPIPRVNPKQMSMFVLTTPTSSTVGISGDHDTAMTLPKLLRGVSEGALGLRPRKSAKVGTPPLMNTLLTAKKYPLLRFQRSTTVGFIEPGSREQAMVKEDMMEGIDEIEEEEAKPTFSLLVKHMKIHQGQHVAVVGTVSSGKTAFIHGILGELYCPKGQVSIHGTIAYCCQDPWIVPGSVRFNVIFNQPFDEEWYEECLIATCLKKDLRFLADGDETEIGERGVNLSGGQKHRVSLARALYFRRDIYIMDDPLSSLDHNITKELFERCFNGILKDKTVIVCLNQHEWLHHFDSIVVVDAVSDELPEVEGLLKNSVAKLVTGKKYNLKNVTEAVDVARRDELYHQLSGSKSSCSLLKKKKKSYSGTMIKEEAQVSVIHYSTLKKFAGYAGYWLIIGSLILFTLKEIAYQCSVLLLGVWTDQYLLTGSTPVFYEILLFVFFFISVLLYIPATLLLNIGLRDAGKEIHDVLMNKCITAPISFFDTTPIGRITNWFIIDILQLDNITMRALLLSLIQLGLSFIAFFITSTIAIPWIGLLYIFIFGIVCYLVYYFIKYMVCSYLYYCRVRPQHLAVFSSLIGGTESINAYDLIDYTRELSTSSFNSLNNSVYCSFRMVLWAQARTCALSCTVTILAPVFLITLERLGSPMVSSSTTGRSGVVLTSITSFSFLINGVIFVFPQLIELLASVQRLILGIDDMESEAPMTIEGQPPEGWPNSGSIVFDDVRMRYREGTPLILTGFSLKVNPGEKLGIVGRSGCGKSTLGLLLFRLAEPEDGTIYIDGLDYTKVGLRDLRNATSYLGQEPLMFSGTLRNNLDPEHRYSDREIWKAISASHCEDFVPIRTDIDEEVAEFGSNFSVGARQLFCLARTVLERRKIVFLDEATGHIDEKTEKLVESTVEEQFGDCTVLAIAHRLDTISGFDRFVKLENGKAIEVSKHQVVGNSAPLG